MNKASDQDGFRLRWSDLWAFLPMVAFTLFAAFLAAQQQKADALAQHATITQTNVGEPPMQVDLAKHK
jgi:hypothetical protein